MRTHRWHPRGHTLPAHPALYLEPSLGMQTCISGLSATQTKKKKGTRKTSWVPVLNPNSKREKRPPHRVKHHSFSGGRLQGWLFSPRSHEENASHSLDGCFVKKEATRQMSMERTGCFENLKVIPSVLGLWTLPRTPNTGSPLRKRGPKALRVSALQRTPADALPGPRLLCRKNTWHLRRFLTGKSGDT